jgi:hypothetical protein
VLNTITLKRNISVLWQVQVNGRDFQLNAWFLHVQVSVYGPRQEQHARGIVHAKEARPPLWPNDKGCGGVGVTVAHRQIQRWVLAIENKNSINNYVFVLWSYECN